MNHDSPPVNFQSAIHITLFFLLSLLSSQTLFAAEQIETLTAHRIPRTDYLQLNARIEAINQGTIAAQTHGRILNIFVDVNDQVEKGALLLQIDDIQQRTQRLQAEALLKEATAQFQEALIQYQRLSKLLNQKSVAPSQVDASEAAVKAAQARQQAAQAAVTAAQQQLEYTQVRAPYSGIVTARHAEIGELASPGLPLMSGLALSPLRATFFVPQAYWPLLQDHPVVELQNRATRSWTKATQTVVFPYAHPGNSQIQVRSTLPDALQSSNRYIPGAWIKVRIAAGVSDQISLPCDSLILRHELQAVYVLDDQHLPKLRPVNAGLCGEGEVLILSGLFEGERVVRFPAKLFSTTESNHSESNYPESN
ncbi:MAG: efflux RND transporter periplasmic adaptor subunit [Hahellaceae bacterium]|nr:efflux RND transporter periplasmic adaptor subunit [Hahellaceae bacterium]